MDALGRISVLVLDDDQDMRTLIQEHLKDFEKVKAVYLSQNTTEALIKMQNVKVDLIITDYNLEAQKNGLQFIQSIEQQAGSGNIKFLLISSQLPPDELPKAYFSVGSNILIKPFSREKILQKIASIYSWE